ncbi:MAG TPA: nucleotidyltransferase domain-containing protein [Lacunisphaera sp.]|nr:nucleotidyltransferase domain-containing protein [Lacunisphaera sp.]
MPTPGLPAMAAHHADSIRNLVAAFEPDRSILALLLGGSLAHGFARPDSDIDVAIVVAPAEYARRQRENRLHYNNRTLCTYPGYIDGKYLDPDFLRLVAARGSDPARYAFKDCHILFSRLAGLDALLAEIVRFPVEQKRERTERFAAQLLAWRWYYSEALRQQNPYLVHLALQKVVLFGCRLILTENETLYPYHKWLLRVTESVPRQPPNLQAALAELTGPNPAWERVDAWTREIFSFLGVDHDAANAAWPTRFMKDTELRWMTEEAAIDDL